MWSLVASLASSASGLIAMLAVVAGLIGAGAFGQHKIDADSLDKLKAGYATAQAKATAAALAEQQQIDAATTHASQASLNRERETNARLQTQLSKVPSHVTNTPGNCVSWGLVRVLDGAVLGTDPGRFNLPAGKSDASCSTITSLELAQSIVSNYGKYTLTAQRLTALQAWVREMSAATQKAAKQ